MGEMVLGRGADCEGMVARLFATFQMQLREIEAKVRDGAGERIGEDTRTLQGLAKTLETLLTLDRRVTLADGSAAPDVEGLRAKVMERLASLRRVRAAKTA